MAADPLRTEIWIAWRHLRKRRGERFISLITWLSMAGVALGVASVITVYSVMTGYSELLRDKIVGLNAHITAYPERRGLTPGEAVSRAMGVEGVKSAAPFVLGQAMIASKTRTTGIMVRGIEASSKEENGQLARLITGETLAALGGGRATMLIGRELASEMKLARGDTVKVTVPAGGAPRLASFRIAGVFATGMYEFDSKIALINLEDAKTLLGMGDNLAGIEIRVGNLDETGKIMGGIKDVLGPDYIVLDWKRQNHNMFYALELQRVVLSLIMGLVVLVAAFNMAATLIMMVLEKTREIGILKAMGASGRTIGRIFAAEGLMIGTTGAAAGTLMGLGLCYLQDRYGLVTIPNDIYLFSVLPVAVNPVISMLFAAGAVLLCYLAALYPSARAARMNPVDAIRTE